MRSSGGRKTRNRFIERCGRSWNGSPQAAVEPRRSNALMLNWAVARVALIEEREFREAKNQARVVLYYGDSNDNERIYCEVLIGTHAHGLWLKSESAPDKVERMLGQNVDIARAYRPLASDVPLPKESWLYLEYGAIALPYVSQEKDSGNYPEIRIRMDSPNGQLDEKLKLWDSILSSFKPVGS